MRPLFCPNPLAAVDRGVAAPAARPAAANRDRKYVNNASGPACVESRDHVSLDPCLPAERLDKYIFSQDLLSPAPQVSLRPSLCLCPTTKAFSVTVLAPAFYTLSCISPTVICRHPPSWMTSTSPSPSGGRVAVSPRPNPSRMLRDLSRPPQKLPERGPNVVSASQTRASTPAAAPHPAA